MEEIWKDIPGYEGKYKASNLGRIKSVQYHGRIRDRILLSTIDKCSGYRRVILIDKLYNRKTFGVHRLICMAFLGKSILSVNHINGDKSDNRISNLEYVTFSENTQHAIRTGLFKRMHKVHQIKDGVIINTFDSMNDAAMITGIKHSNIRCAVIGVYKQSGGFVWKRAE